jgi:tetratricopeptide (TPR) repeat protein
MAPPRLGESQVNCGPYLFDRQVAGRWISLATSRGDYDLGEVANRLPPEQQPDLVAVHVDGSSLAGTPKNLGAFRCPKILLVADTHHGEHPISGIIKYALREQFDRVVLLYDRHHVDLFRGAGVKNLHWFPALTFAHSDSRIAIARQRERQARIALVGTTGYHPRRLRAFSALVEHSLPLSWKQVHQSQAIAHYAESLIGLNVSMNGDLNMRVFEVMAGGAMLLADRLDASSGLQDLLKEGREWVAYDSVSELVERARHFLGHPEEARAIASEGARWFDRNFSEQRRLDAFRALAFDGQDRPEFSLPPARVTFGGGLTFASALSVYESLQLVHLQREEVNVVIDETAPAGLPELLTTLPRVKERHGAGNESCDLAIVTQTKLQTAARADRVWLWDAKTGFRLQDTAGLRGLAGQAAYFGRFAPEVKNALVEHAAAALQQGDVQTAFQYATQAVKTHPVAVRAFFILAELSMEARNWALAKAMLDRARSIDPTHPQLILLGREIELEVPSKQASRMLTTARRAFESKAVDQARGFAFSGLKAEPQSPELLHLAGLIVAHVGDRGGGEASLTKVSEGFGFVTKAIELAPDRLDFRLDHAMLAWEVGRVREASNSFQFLAQCEPSVLAFWGWGVCQLVLGQNARATEILRRALELAPADRQIAQVLSLASERAGFDWHQTEGAACGTATRSHHATLESSGDSDGRLLAVPSLVRQPQVESEMITKRLLTIFHAAADRDWPRDELTAVAPRCVLLAHQPWFGLDVRKIVAAGLDRGLLVALFSDKFVPAETLPWELDRTNFRSVTHRGINLWYTCRYELSLSLCKMPHAIEPEAPNDRRALKGLYAYAIATIDAAFRMMDFYRPESVVVAQGYNVVSAVLREVALQRGTRVVALENIFHRERLLWDDVSGIAVNQNLARNFFWRYRDQVSPAVAEASVQAFLQRMPTFKSADHASPAEGAQVSLREGLFTITYLAQVGLDSSVMFGLSDFASQVDVIIALMRYTLVRNAQLLVKLHPKESRAKEDIGALPPGFTAYALETYPGYNALRAQLGDRFIIDKCNEFSTSDWIRRADVCVTINSQAGLEAAMLTKEVILCGDAFYGGLGFTHDASDASSLAFSLDRVLREGVRRNDKQSCWKFFHVFTELYCIPKSEEALVALAAGSIRVPLDMARQQHAA